jgi:hypothetical protein
MRFFIPSTTNTYEAENAYQKIRENILSSNEDISDRRIYRLKFEHDGNQRTAVVGSDRHGFGEGAVLAIFERSDGCFYICTQKANQFEAEPHTVQTGAVIETEEFSASA